MFGAILGSAAISAASSLLGNYMNARAAENMADDNIGRSKDLGIWQARELPKLQVEGLRAAGINPLYAYGNIGSASAPLVHNDAPRYDYSGIGRALSDLPERASALATAQTQREVLSSQVDRNLADVRESDSRIALNKAHMYDTLGLSKRQIAEIARLEALTDLTREQKKYLGKGSIRTPFGGASWSRNPVSSAYDLGKSFDEPLSKWIISLGNVNKKALYASKPVTPADKRAARRARERREFLDKHYRSLSSPQAAGDLFRMENL